MNYLTWNKLIGNYFFNPSSAGKEVFLYGSKSIILDVFKSSRYYDEFVVDLMEENQLTAPIEQQIIDQEVWVDYCKALRIGPIYNNKLKGWFEKIDDCWRLWDVKKQQTLQGDEIQYPLYLAYLVTLILPLAENEDDFSANNYYDRVVTYFKNNQLLTKQETGELEKNYDSFKNIFGNHFRGIEPCWIGLSNWSIINNCGMWGIFKVKRIGGFSHVGKPFAECIITKQQKQLIPLLFEKANYQVNDRIPIDVFKNLLAAHGKDILRYPANKWYSITQNNDLVALLSSVLKEEYDSWTGKVIVINEKNRELLGSSTTLNLHLSVNINAGEESISGFKFRFFQVNNTDNYDDYHFTFKSSEVNEIDFYTSGWSKTKINLPLPLEEVLVQKVVYTDKLNQLKAIHIPSDLYLFSSHPSLNDFNSKTRLSYTGEFFLLCKYSLRDKIQAWLPSCKQYEILDYYSGIPTGWLLYFFKNPQQSCPGIKELTLPSTVTLEKVEGVKLEGATYLNAFPIRLSFSGLHEKQVIQAKSDDGSIIQDLTPLEDGRFEIKPDYFTIWQKFTIQTSDGIAFSNSFQFREYQLPTTYNEPSLDKLGFPAIGNEEIMPIKGLSVTYTPEIYGAALALYYNSNLVEDPDEPSIIGKYRYTDHLLYCLSVLESFDVDFFNKAFMTCFEQSGKEVFANYYLKRALDYYHQLGFINYDYIKLEKRYSITLNSPTFLALPMRVVQEPYYQVLLTGARTPGLIESLLDYSQRNPGLHIDFLQEHDGEMTIKYLLPQIIILKSRTRETFVTAASNLGINFQPDIYYPLSVIKHVTDISYFGEYFLKSPDFEWKDYAMTKSYIDSVSLSIVKSTQGIDTSLNFVEYYPGTYQAKCILWKDDRPYVVDKSWGRYYFLDKIGQSSVLKYQASTSQLFVPAKFSLPKIIGRALCLMSGKAPLEQWIGGQLYNVYFMPDKLEWNIIKSKLNQRNHI